MRNWILFILNLIIILPCIILGNVGTKFMIIIWVITFGLSVVNLILSRSKKELFVYCLLLLFASSIGMYINGQLYFRSLDDKQIWYDLEGDLTYFISTTIHFISCLVIMSIEFLIKHFLIKRKINSIQIVHKFYNY